MPPSDTPISKEILLPCLVFSPPIFNNGDFYIFSCALNEDSEAVDWDQLNQILPSQWFVGENRSHRNRSSRFGNTNFVVKINDSDIHHGFESSTPFVFSGQVVDNVRFGEQFAATLMFPDIGNDEEAMTKYLQDLPNIGPKRADQIVEKFGYDNVQSIFDSGGQELLKIAGITKERLPVIIEHWKRDVAVRELLLFLAEHEVSFTYGKKIIKHFGEKAFEILKTNPFRLTEIYGIGFEQADDIAYKIMDDVPKDYRTKSCLEYLLMAEGSNSGSTCMPSDSLVGRAITLLKRRDPDHDYKLECIESIKSDFVIVKDDEVFVYTPSSFLREKYIAGYVESFGPLPSHPKWECTDDEITDAEYLYTEAMGRELVLDVEQKDAIKAAFKNHLCIITGGGGTGKSTICRCICTIAQKKGLSVELIAPTGRAAKVLSSKTLNDASTIHRALALAPGDARLTHDIYTPNDVEIGSSILIIDEFSMVGVDTFPLVIDAIRDRQNTNVVLIGDHQQLPSVSPGRLLHDIMRSETVPVTVLKNIHRQSENSHICDVAQDVADGNRPTIPTLSDDFHWIESSNNKRVLETLESLVRDAVEEGTLDKLQILSPMKKGDLGTKALNKMIQEMVKDDDRKMVYEDRTFYLGDRVMQLKNNYEKNVYNGDVGVVIEFDEKVINPKVKDKKDRYVKVLYNDTLVVEYVEEGITEIQPSWACTVHKYQGSQIENVVFLMSWGHNRMMYRELVYTGFTRASDNLYVLGSQDVLDLASSRSDGRKRYTKLTELIARPNELQIRNAHLPVR
jgi:exodeoxyribonuclease V alpha subunit